MKNYKRIHSLILMCLSLLMISSELFATGVLYVRPRFSQQQYEKMWIKTIDVDVNIQDQVAETKVDQIFVNELNASAEAIYIFPLPKNAMITKLVYWFNGQRYEAKIRERQAAVDDYNRKLRQWMDPALLEYLGDNLFRLSIVPVNANSEVRTEITYVELLDYDFGKIQYKCLLNTYDLSPKPMETVHLSLKAQTQNTFKYFNSPSHGNSSATLITKHSDSFYSLDFGDEDFFPDKDLFVNFETVREDIQFNLLTYSPVPEDSMGTDSFYALWITPPDTIADDQVIPKDIVFTVDVSSSMEGERINQIKEALTVFLEQLNAGDRFNIITFGTHVVSFKPDIIEATEENILSAKRFAADIYAFGMTNISAAFDSSLSQSFGENTSKDIIFFTDGRPTAGQTNADSILTGINKKNTKNVRIFSFGVDEEVNKALLTSLSNENNGYATFIREDDDISFLISNHFKRISKPVVTGIQVDYGGIQVWDIYPKTQLDLFWGQQSIEMGLYRNSGTDVVTLTGNVGSKPVEYSKTVTFPDEGGYRFVARLWARAKINSLLQLIEIYGETDELVNQVIDLSIRFGILTEYTALYSDPATHAENDKEELPNKFFVSRNYPNPFNPVTHIKYTLPEGKNSYKVTIKIFDTLGRLIKILVNEEQASGFYEVAWDGTDLFGKQVSSGVYICTVRAGEFNVSRKMVLMR